MNKIHRIRKKSLFFQVFLIVGIIFTSTLILNNIQDIFRERIYRESQKLMKVSICFNDITVKLQILQDRWKLMLDNLDTEKGKLETEDILDDSEQLTEYLNEEKYNRSSIDLYYTIETYLLTYGMIRFVLENLRYDAVRGSMMGISTSQWISLIMIILSIGSVCRRKIRKLKGE